MRVTNKTSKIIHVGLVTILPDKTETISKNAETSSAVRALIERGDLKVAAEKPSGKAVKGSRKGAGAKGDTEDTGEEEGAQKGEEAYIKDVWGLETKASACTFCPFHRNQFFSYLKKEEPGEYGRLLKVDELLRDKNPKPPMDSDLFISRSRKRIADLTPEDCQDGEYFDYRGQQVWNGF